MHLRPAVAKLVAVLSVEQDKQRFRWFRANYGFMRAKQHAEDQLRALEVFLFEIAFMKDFRRSLIEAGRATPR